MKACTPLLLLAAALGALATPRLGAAGEAPPVVAAASSDPNGSRLMFAPTGRPLGRGNGYFSDHYVLFPGAAYGLTPNLSVGGGFSFVPGQGLDEQAFYVNLHSGWNLGRDSAVAVGGFFAGAGVEDVADFGVGALYAVGTLGPPERSLSVGIAAVAERNEEYYFAPGGEYLRTERTWRFHDAPVLMVGGSLRLARQLSLISENWLVVGDGFDLSEQPFGLAVRFYGGRLSADVGVVIVPAALDEGFPVPWLSFSYHFGPSRKAPSRSTSAPLPARTQASARGTR